MPTSRHTTQALSIHQALEASAPLATLQQRVRQSQALLELVLPLIPVPLRTHLSAGPLESGEWCIFVNNAAIHSKLRQLVPALLRSLSAQGSPVERIRLKTVSKGQ